MKPSVCIEPNTTSTQFCTGELVIATSFCLQSFRTCQPNDLGRTRRRIDKGVPLCPAMWVCKIDRHLLAKSFWVVVDIRINRGSIPHLHCLQNGKVSGLQNVRIKMQCCLPKALRSLCRTGCIYREFPFQHLKCPLVSQTERCAAPCQKPCDCSGTRETPKTNPQDNKNRLPCLQ